MPLVPPLPEGGVGQPILAVLSAGGLVRNRKRSLLANTSCSHAASSEFLEARATPPVPAIKNNSLSESRAAAAKPQKTATRAKAALSASRPNQKTPRFARSPLVFSCDFPGNLLPAAPRHSIREIFPPLQQHRQPSHKTKT